MRTASREIDEGEDIIDSRDVIERIDRLRDDEEAGLIDEEEIEELTKLVKLDDEGRTATSDWEDGATLIRDSYFVKYAEELASDLGYVEEDASWPHNCIDWDRAARELQSDYTDVTFGGTTYWVRG